MGLDARDLARMSPKAQQQIIEKLGAKQRQKESKYKNVRTTVRGITFDSGKEAQRYEELMQLLRAGKIRKLKLQQDFTLQEAYTTETGERVRAIKYRADFAYERATKPDAAGEIYWLQEVEDVKGVRTEQYKLKKKMMLEKYGIAIKEI